MRTVACAWLPNWPLQRLRYERPELKKQPVIIYETLGNRGPCVRACSRQPVQLGVTPGMPLAEAQALVEASPPNPQDRAPHHNHEVHFELHNPVADRTCLRGIAQSCECFSPLYGLEETESPECVLLDVTGCTHLFGGDHGLAVGLVNQLRAQGLHVRGSVTPTIGSAWAVAHFLARSTEPTVVAVERLPQALNPLPAAALRLSHKTLTRLGELGLQTVGQLRALPRSTLPSRFGTELLKRLDQAFGSEAELLVPQSTPTPFIAQWAGEWPLTNQDALHCIVQELLNELLNRLKPQRAGVRQLLCSIREPGGRTHEFCVNCVVPTDVAKHLLEMLALQWERRLLPEEIVFVRLEATLTDRLQVRQRDLFGHALDGDDQREVVALLDRLSNRLGFRAVVKTRLVPDAQPELAVAYEAWTQTESQNTSPKVRQSESHTHSTISLLFPTTLARPTHLLSPPQEIEVSIAGPEGAPLSFYWDRYEHRVIRSWGPERIETGWWRDEPIARDYFRVETQTGHHFWLFHQFHAEGWFMHGTFD